MQDFLLFDSRQTNAKICGDVLRKLTLKAGNVRHGALVMLTPELGTGGDVHQFSLYDDAIGIPKQAAGEHGFDFEVVADATDVGW